jgi:hypothetical protein
LVQSVNKFLLILEPADRDSPFLLVSLDQGRLLWWCNWGRLLRSQTRPARL